MMTTTQDRSSHDREDNVAGADPMEAQRIAVQRKRSIAIAVSLGLFVLLFYLATLIKLSGNGPLATKSEAKAPEAPASSTTSGASTGATAGGQQQ